MSVCPAAAWSGERNSEPDVGGSLDTVEGIKCTKSVYQLLKSNWFTHLPFYKLLILFSSFLENSSASGHSGYPLFFPLALTGLLVAACVLQRGPVVFRGWCTEGVNSHSDCDYPKGQSQVSKEMSSICCNRLRFPHTYCATAEEALVLLLPVC